MISKLLKLPTVKLNEPKFEGSKSKSDKSNSTARDSMISTARDSMISTVNVNYAVTVGSAAIEYEIVTVYGVMISL